MIVSGKGTGKMRYLMGNPSTMNKSVNLERPPGISPDSRSVVTIVTSVGWMFFANHDHGGAGPITDFYPSADVIHAYNRLHQLGSGINQVGGIYTAAQGMLTSWHTQMLNNEVTSDAVANPRLLVGRLANFSVQEADLMITSGDSRPNA